jgi:glycosyl transferase family 25
MDIFVISLPDAKGRREFIADQLRRLDLAFEFVDAIRGKDVYDRNMTPGEVGCALSHQKVYDIMFERGLPHAFVLEDDAMLSRDLPEALRLLETRIRPNDLIQLERCDVHSRKGMEPLFKEYRIVRPTMVKYGSMCQSAGYIITREAAAKIRLINRPVHVPADSWGQYRGQINFRGIIPTLTLVKQNVSFECTTQDYQRSEFTPSTPLSLLVYAFKTRSRLGRFMVRTAKKILRRG